MKYRKLLFITQKIDQKDDDLAFVILWIKEFIKQGFEVQVICLQKGPFDDSFPVFSLGKENGVGKFRRLWKFIRLITSLEYETVFVHMNPEYFTYGGWYWILKRIPTYLWYTHYKMHIHLRLAGWISKRMFAATPQSLPQYDGNPKKIVTGHGIDVNFWESIISAAAEDHRISETDLLMVHRICRSKRLEIGIKALEYLPAEYNLTVYGRDVEKDYYKEMKDLVRSEHLESRVKFAGPVPMPELRAIYPKYRLMVNMAYETIDKTMLEAMLFGIYPVTTKANSIAIGLTTYPENDDPETVAGFIREGEWQVYDRYRLHSIVEQNHSLRSLIGKMKQYISQGL